ncbi:MAG: hypothetical protein L6W00_02540 [Lentisphaeria bacterium]|nr:MAG: hypothetical protein L6W00_02540 [Lentisphaeria bacterium]
MEAARSVSNRYALQGAVLEGFCLAVVTPRTPPLPEQLEDELRQQLFSPLMFNSNAAGKIDLFRILEQGRAFAPAEEFDLPLCSRGNLFLQLDSQTKRKLQLRIAACREKNFGHKIVRALCGSWNNKPLIEICAEHLPELRKMTPEKRARLWETFRNLFSQDFTLRDEPELDRHPELKQLILEDTRREYETRYRQALEQKELPRQNDRRNCNELKLLYFWFRQEDDARADKLADHLCRLAKDSALGEWQLRSVFGHSFDLRFRRKMKEVGLTSDQPVSLPVRAGGTLPERIRTHAAGGTAPALPRALRGDRGDVRGAVQRRGRPPAGFPISLPHPGRTRLSESDVRRDEIGRARGGRRPQTLPASGRIRRRETVGGVAPRRGGAGRALPEQERLRHRAPVAHGAPGAVRGIAAGSRNLPEHDRRTDEADPEQSRQGARRLRRTASRSRPEPGRRSAGRNSPARSPDSSTPVMRTSRF